MLPPALAQDPDDVAAAFVEPSVERGQYIVGNTAIGDGHAGIFGTIYAGSVNRMELVRAAEVSDGVIIAVSRNTLDCPTGPLAGRHDAMSTSVLVRPEAADGDWLIVSTHNTLVTG